MYIPSKPDKYGLKIWILCDTETAYCYNASVYTGKIGDVPQLNQGQTVTLKLAEPIFKSHRNITMDNFFTSIPLTDEMQRQGLMLLGTLRKNKREIPSEFQPNRKRDVHSTLFGFDTNKTLCSYVPKKGKAVVLLSTVHHDDTVTAIAGKPEMIINYNEIKGAVDTLDKIVHAYSCNQLQPISLADGPTKCFSTF